MYAFLDRAVWDLKEPYRFLLAATRTWVGAVRGGRCPCSAVADGFAARGIPLAAREFGNAMAALDRHGLGTLRFGSGDCADVREDEARVLGLFEAAMAGMPGRVRRIVATLVAEEAVGGLATAAEWVAVHLTGGTFVERD